MVRELQGAYHGLGIRKAAGKRGGRAVRPSACFMLEMDTEPRGYRPKEEMYRWGCNVSYQGFMGSSPKFIKLFVPQFPFCSPYLIGLFLRLM